MGSRDCTLLGSFGIFVQCLLALACIGVIIQICLWVQGKGSGALPVYALGVLTIWTALQMQSWKRAQAALAFVWGNEALEERERPRADFVASFRRGLWRSAAHGGRDAMRREKGIYLPAALQLNLAWPSPAERFVSLETSATIGEAREDASLRAATEAQEAVLVMSSGARFAAVVAGAPLLLGLMLGALIANLAVLMFMLVASVSLQAWSYHHHPHLRARCEQRCGQRCEHASSRRIDT